MEHDSDQIHARGRKQKKHSKEKENNNGWTLYQTETLPEQNMEKKKG